MKTVKKIVEEYVMNLKYENTVQKDVVAVGLGPSNLALAIAAQEQGCDPSQWLFLERNMECMWHPGMLLDGARLQISFLKDLVTLRNPRSFFSFINYLKENDRLDEFINLSQFNPTRLEYNHYLNWVKQNLPQEMLHMGAEVVQIQPMKNKENIVDSLVIHYRRRDGEVVRVMTKNIVVAVGGTPFIPPSFARLLDENIFHSSQYLKRIKSYDPIKRHRFCVVGSGQSAVEIILHLSSRFPESSIVSIQRSVTFKPADNSPFVNEIFFPNKVDFVFNLEDNERRSKIKDFYYYTNYSAVETELLESLYQKIYDDKWKNQSQIMLYPNTDILNVKQIDNKVFVEAQNNLSEDLLSFADLDAVILATGYDRQTMPAFMEPLEPYVLKQDQAFSIDRNYRLETTKDMGCNIYMQGMSEFTHGIADTLLSILPVRANEIWQDISNRTLSMSPETLEVICNVYPSAYE